MRRIIKELRFDEELSRIEGNPVAADSLIEAAEWALSRDPDLGIRISNSIVRGLLVTQCGRRFVVYYVFDDDLVIFLSIIESPDGLRAFR